jgi:tetratricopeptide (TPR) repeat protein
MDLLRHEGFKVLTSDPGLAPRCLLMAGHLDAATKRSLPLAEMRDAVASNDPARIAVSARAVLERDPLHASALLALARALDALGDVRDAARAWNTLLEVDHPRVSHFLFAVRSAEGRGDRLTAIALCRKGLRIFPHDLPLLLAAAKNALALDRHPAAIAYFTRYTAADLNAGLRLVSESYRKGRLTQTVCCYIALRRQSPVPKAAASWGVTLKDVVDSAGLQEVAPERARDLATAARLLQAARRLQPDSA